MKFKQNQRLGWIPVFAAGILVLVLGTWWGISKIPSLSDQFPLNDIPLTITILTPEDSSEWPADAFVPIHVVTRGSTNVQFLELWIDGILIDSLKLDENSESLLSHVFYWLPDGPGKARILIRAAAEFGKTGHSNPINITISNPTGIRLISLPESSAAVDEISYPIQPPGNFIDDFRPPQAPGSMPDNPQPANSDFSLWLGNQFSTNESIPASPIINHIAENCNVQLSITDQSDNEQGFFIYRSLAGANAFERIATLGPEDKGSSFSYVDINQTDGVIYYVSAFNGAGESSSAPLFIQLLPDTCLKDSGTTTLATLDQEDFQLLNLAYFYYSFNGGGFQRYPANIEVFLTPSEYPTSLSSLIQHLVHKSTYPVSSADLVVWGWQGGSLVNLGAQHVIIDDSRLTVCNLGTNCTGDVASGFRSTFGELANDEEDQIREFYWQSTSPGATSILWQISTSPFPSGFSPKPYGLVGAACLDGIQGGSFLVDFSTLESYLPAPSSCGTAPTPWIQNTQLDFLKQIRSSSITHYYIRFIPMAGNQPAGKPSNTVEILAKPAETHLEPIIVDHLPDIYDVEITDFIPAKNSDPQWWGCVSITDLDYNMIWESFRNTYPNSISDDFISDSATALYDQLKYAKDNNLLICPTDYVKQDESVLSEWRAMLTEGLESFWSSITSAFEALKTGIVDAVAAGLNAINIPCDTTCKAALKTGLEIAFTYFTGLPPSLPDFDRLVDDGLNYAIEVAAAEAGIPCPEDCKELIKKELEAVIEAVAKSKSQPACVDENWAHVLGKNAFCFPPGVETKPYPPGVSTQASAEVKVTRSGSAAAGGTPAFKYHDQNSYVLFLKFTASNDNMIGQTIPYEYEYWRDSNSTDWQQSGSVKEWFTVYATPGSAEGQIYQPEYIPIPPLDPGESITIPISLKNAEFYFIEHLGALYAELGTRNLDISDVGGLGGRKGIFYDWFCLYFGSQIKIEAEVYCLDVSPGLIGSTEPGEDSSLVPCGSTAIPLEYQQPDQTYYP